MSVTDLNIKGTDAAVYNWIKKDKKKSVNASNEDKQQGEQHVRLQ